jgi:hypothetical protein
MKWSERTTGVTLTRPATKLPAVQRTLPARAAIRAGHLRSERRGAVPFPMVHNDPAMSAPAKAGPWEAAGAPDRRAAPEASSPDDQAVELGLGTLAILLRSSGTTTAPSDAGGNDAALGAAGYARLGGTIALSPRIALRADLLAGGAFRRPVVSVASSAGPPSPPTDQAAWGSAFGALLAGLEARWF